MNPADRTPKRLELTRDAAGRLELRGPEPGRGVCVDFLEPAILRRVRGQARRTHPLARAVGRKAPLPDVLDATAGLGRDAFVLACLGYAVTAVERSDTLFALLEDGVARLRADPRAADLVGDRLQVVHAEATQVMHTVSPRVVYLDPMFPSRDDSALVKKEMQILQRLLGSDPDDAAELLRAARGCATDRVAVKRPARAPTLAPDVSYQVRGAKVRWDVYLTPPS